VTWVLLLQVALMLPLLLQRTQRQRAAARHVALVQASSAPPAQQHRRVAVCGAELGGGVRWQPQHSSSCVSCQGCHRHLISQSLSSHSHSESIVIITTASAHQQKMAPSRFVTGSPAAPASGEPAGPDALQGCTASCRGLLAVLSWAGRGLGWRGDLPLILALPPQLTAPLPCNMLLTGCS
jgi:hypothetical protein